MHFGFDDLRRGGGPAPLDAVVHFAAIPRILMRPDNAMFAANALSTHNVVEAATTRGVRKVIIASSITAYGVCFTEGDRDYTGFPVDEGYDADPTDSYGLSKLVGEKIAQPLFLARAPTSTRFGFASSWSPRTISDFRRPLADPLSRKRDRWSYIDVRDLAQIVDLCIEKNGLGFQVFNATNDEIVANEPTMSFLAKHARQRREHVNWRALRLRCPTARLGSSWASARSTTGESTSLALVKRQARP